MKPEEKIAKKYLEQQGLGLPVYEPNGPYTTPDFVFVSQQKAIEVRRLNRSLSTDGKLREDDFYRSFWDKLKAVLNSLDRQGYDKSYQIAINYIAPSSHHKPNKKQIYQELKKILDSKDSEFPYTLPLCDGLVLHIQELPSIEAPTFHLAYMGFEIRNMAYISTV